MSQFIAEPSISSQYSRENGPLWKAAAVLLRSWKQNSQLVPDAKPHHQKANRQRRLVPWALTYYWAKALWRKVTTNTNFSPLSATGGHQASAAWISQLPSMNKEETEGTLPLPVGQQPSALPALFCHSKVKVRTNRSQPCAQHAELTQTVLQQATLSSDKTSLKDVLWPFTQNPVFRLTWNEPTEQILTSDFNKDQTLRKPVKV